MKKINKLKKIIFATFTSLFAITSCEIGLGSALDLTPPKIEIVSPKEVGFVQQDLLIRGIATDNQQVSKIEVTIATKDNVAQQFKWEGGKWLRYTNDSWQEYSSATISGTLTRYEWTIQTRLDDYIDNQQVYITAVVSDIYANSSAQSKSERSVTVDTIKPNATVSEPLVSKNYVEVQQKYNDAVLKNDLILSNLINGDFEIKVNQTENARTGKFIVMIDEEKDTTIPSYEDVPDLLSLNHLYSKTVEGARSFSIPVKNQELNSSIQNGKHLLRLVTESYDEAGNLCRDFQGFFVYWNEADKPWTSMSSGDENFIESATQASVYPGSELFGYAYDDDGLQNIEIIFEVRDENNNWIKDEGRSKTITFDSSENNTWTKWSIKALAESKHFRITSTPTDKNGLKGEPYTRYFRTSDVNPPQLSNIKVSPLSNESYLLGDKDGKFKITGDIQDDTGIKSIKMIYIAAKNKDKFASYYTNSSLWQNQQNGDLCFSLEHNGKTENNIWKGTFEKEINIFDDIAKGGLGIGKSGNDDNIKNYMFIFRVEDLSGVVATETFTCQGDIDAPTLKIEKVVVVHQDKTTKKEYSFSSGTPILDAYNRSAQHKITDKLYFTGTWSDNSVDNWSNNLTNQKKDTTKIKTITLSNGATVTMKDDGTWQSAEFEPTDSTSYNITATLTDFGANTTKASESFFISSDNPELLRITSENPNGRYKDGAKITIVLEYNKKMTFSGGSSPNSNPQLVLNNGGIATYSSGNGESKHKYLYEVGKTTNTTATTNTSGKANIEKLNVTSITTNNNTWKDSQNKVISQPTKLPESNNLSDNREIYIDNDAPRIKNVKAITGSGYYNAGRDLNFQIEFSKDVEITNLSDLKLKVNISNNGKNETEIPATTKIDSKTVLFKYTIKDGDNTSNTTNETALKFVSFTGGSDNIKDSAGNSMTNVEPETKDIDNANIYVDTTKPAKPTIAGITNNGLYYADVSNITISEIESSNATGYYSFDGGNSWTAYNNLVSTIAQNGIYKVCAKQIDKAGNESDISEVIQITLDKGNLLTSISSTNSPKIYKKGDTIDINLRFRKPVTFTGDVKLKLGELNEDGTEKTSLTTKASLAQNQTTASQEIHFTYTVLETDFCSPLEVLGIECGTGGSIKDEKEQDVKDYIKTSELRLSKIRNIELLNGNPKVITDGVKLEKTKDKERQLKITFNSKIAKQSNGYITLKQKDVQSKFEAPAILTKAQYDEYKDIEITSTTSSTSSSTTPTKLGDFYKETTNGWNPETQEPDLSTKYVLKYEYDTDNESLVNALKGIYKEANHNLSPDTVPISMASNYVKVWEDGKTLVIDLKDDYTLPVQGADYEVTIPANVVINNINNKNEEVFAKDSTKYVVSNPGIETPVIRVNRVNETISGTQITQHDKTKYKVDCQTPGVTIKLTTKKEQPTYLKLINNGSQNNVVMARQGLNNQKVSTPPPIFELKNQPLPLQVPPNTTIAKKEQKEIGTDFNKNSPTSNTGYKILIGATAEKNGTKSDTAYESAMRTIIILEENGGNKCNSINNAGINKDSRWVRGGDDVSGGVSTADFPFSWNVNEYDKIRAMGHINNNISGNAYWYFISWNINTTAYVEFFAGDIPNDAATKGPQHWLSSSCGWTGLKEQTPVYPGECTIFATNASTLYSGYKYLYGGSDGQKHYGSR